MQGRHIWGEELKCLQGTFVCWQARETQGEGWLDGFFHRCLFPPRWHNRTKYIIFLERYQEQTLFFFSVWYTEEWFSLDSLPFCSLRLLVVSHLFVTSERCLKLLQKHMILLWRVSLTKIRTFLGLTLWSSAPFWDGHRAEMGWLDCFDEQIRMTWRHDTKSGVTGVLSVGGPENRSVVLASGV